MGQSNQRLEILTEKIKEIHELCHEIIYLRPAVEDPLTDYEQCKYNKLENSCRALQQEAKALEKLIKLEGQTFPDLTHQETVLLIALNNAKSSQDVYDLIAKTGLNRSRIYEHLRKFIIVGWVTRVTGKKYCITDSGKSFYQNNKKSDK